jgi:hypothetical protein
MNLVPFIFPLLLSRCTGVCINSQPSLALQTNRPTPLQAHTALSVYLILQGRFLLINPSQRTSWANLRSMSAAMHKPQHWRTTFPTKPGSVSRRRQPRPRTRPPSSSGALRSRATRHMPRKVSRTSLPQWGGTRTSSP